MQTTPQTTIASPVTLSGVGVHSGRPATVCLRPAAPDSGIVFSRYDAETDIDRELPADHRFVVGTALSTVLGDARFGQVATVEHLLAAAGGLGIDNLVVELDGAELPIMDGSAGDFVAAFEEAGLRRQAGRRRYIEILKPIRVAMGEAAGELVPHAGRRVEVEIDFETPAIGRQAYVFDFETGDFAGDLARARTFGFMGDVESLWARGYALGASFDNTLVVGEGAVMNPEGLRYSDEFVRHKALDAIGDLTLAGAPILGCYRSSRGGHRLNWAVLDALFADPQAWRWRDGIRQVERPQARIGARMPAPAFGPEVS